MKDFIVQSQNILSSPELAKLSLQTTENTKDILDIKKTITEKIFHCGGSSKDGGSRTMSISQVEDTKVYQMIAADLLKNPALVL